MEHKCILCGAKLPNKRGGRCYCPSCRAYMVAERERNANEERKILRVKHELKPKPVFVQRRSPNKNDERYCSKCRYHGKAGVNLCDYFYRTGERRGCPAGVGCNKRRTQS